MAGVDLNIDEIHLLNKYGCRPFPRPEAFTFASSTASSVSNLLLTKQIKCVEILTEKKRLRTTIEFSELLK
jgi:hypothetical protein